MTFEDQIPNLIVTSDGHLLGGQPDSETLEDIAKSGIQQVINVRGENELDWDEESKVCQNGMSYVSLPVLGVNDLSPDLIERFRTALQTGPALIHCGSGNRVGAIFAMIAFRDGASIEDAIEIGERHGLTKMKSALKEWLT